jgi:hypothetical protein
MDGCLTTESDPIAMPSAQEKKRKFSPAWLKSEIRRKSFITMSHGVELLQYTGSTNKQEN